MGESLPIVSDGIKGQVGKSSRVTPVRIKGLPGAVPQSSRLVKADSCADAVMRSMLERSRLCTTFSKTTLFTMPLPVLPCNTPLHWTLCCLPASADSL